MSLGGKLEDFSLPEILQLIGLGSKTGKLTVRGEGKPTCIWFRDGSAISAHPGYRKGKFGDLLVDAGGVKKENIKAALKKQKELTNGGRPARIGTILVEMGFLRKEELIAIIENEIFGSVYEILGKELGEFDFVMESDSFEKDVTAELNTEYVLLEGTRKLDELEYVRKALSDFDSVYEISTDPDFYLTEYTVNEIKIKILIDGKRSIKEIATETKLDIVEVCKTHVKLLQKGIIKLVQTPSEKGLHPLRVTQTRRALFLIR
jgi:hypothetical protein